VADDSVAGEELVGATGEGEMLALGSPYSPP